MRFALPGYANVWQVLVKSTALVSVIGLQDLVGLANDAGKTAREPFVFFAAVLGVYLAITWASTTLFERLERRSAPRGSPMRVDLVLANWTLFAEGVWMTLQLTALALAVGFCIALPAGLARARRVPWASPLINGYVYLFRGTPLLVQTFLIYYGLVAVRLDPRQLGLDLPARALVVRGDRLLAELRRLHDRDRPRRRRDHAQGRARGRPRARPLARARSTSWC